MASSEAWQYAPAPPPAVTLAGLRFTDRQVEKGYQSWRTGHVRSFTRFALYAATSAAISAWIAVVSGALIDLRGLALVLITLEVVFLVLGAVVAARPGRDQQLGWWTWLANIFGGFLAVTLTRPLHDISATAGCVTLAAFFGLTMYRMRPLQAFAAVTPYVVFGVVEAIQWGADDVIPKHLMIIGIFVLLTTLLTGGLVNLAVEWITRQTYIDHLTIVDQREALFEERTNMARFLSPEVAEAIHDRGLTATVRTEMLSLTAVSIDLRGFTAYTQVHGAETMAVVLREFYEAVVDSARMWGATVKDFAGDGAMVLVGAPLQRADHTRAGLRLAREMLKRVREVTARHSRPNTPLGAGIGIASGECAVGPIGSLAQLEYTAVGTAVNLSSRLCDLARDGQILMAPGTARALEEAPGWRREQVVVPGIAEPVEVTIEETLLAPPKVLPAKLAVLSPPEEAGDSHTETAAEEGVS